MAIVIEEEKKNRVSIVRLGGWIVVLIVIFLGAYYLFFVQPPPATVTPPAALENIAQVQGLTISPQDVLNNPAFQALKPPSFPLPSPQGPVPVGRTDPFVAP